MRTVRWWQVLAGVAGVALAGTVSPYIAVALVPLLASAVFLRRTEELVDLTELEEIDLREPVSPVVTRPVVMRRTLLPFDPFDPPAAFARRTVRN